MKVYINGVIRPAYIYTYVSILTINTFKRIIPNSINSLHHIYTSPVIIFLDIFFTDCSSTSFVYSFLSIPHF